MLMVLLNWLYIAITAFGSGYAVLLGLSSCFKRQMNKVLPIILAGIVFNTVYAQTWSLFGGVGIVANVVLLAFVLVVYIVRRRHIAELLGAMKAKICEVRPLPYIYLAVILLMAYGSSRGYIHYDTSLYHAQSIRWIEEYGVVKGLACLQLRFGYNSSAFALTALYSFAGIAGQSLHTTSGFFALIGAVQVVDIYKIFRTGEVRHSDFIRIGLLFYLGLIYKEMVSPASDYYAQVLIFTSLIMWLDALDDDKDAYPFAMISILLVYAATIKFSIAFMVLLVIKPAIMLVRSKQIKQIVSSLAAGVVVLLPFFIRNVLISGWLIYPSTFIDLFNVDWKIPKGVAQYDAMEIGVYGKGINDVTKLDMPMSQWLPNWFRQMSVIEKGWVTLTAICLIIGIIYFAYKIIRKTVNWDKLLVFAVVAVSCIFWFVSAPLVRYGYGYLTCVPLIVDGCLCLELVQKTGDRKSLYYAYLLVFTVISLYRIKTVGYDIIRTFNQPYYISQEDYVDWPAKEYNLDGHTIYVPEQDALIGYNQFPASVLTIDVQMRGTEFEDGFRYRDYQGFLDDYYKQ